MCVSVMCVALRWETNFTTTGADASGCNIGKSSVLAIIFLENTRELPEMITNSGAKFW